MNRPSQPSVVQVLEKMTNLFYLMVGLPLLAFAWIYLNLKNISPHEFFVVPGFRPYAHGIILLTALAIAGWAFVQYRRRFTGLEPDGPEQESARESLNRKVLLFREASMKKYVLLTLSTIIIVLGFYLSAEENYGGAYSVLLIIFSINRPTPQKLIRDMRLKKEERELVYKSVKESRYPSSES